MSFPQNASGTLGTTTLILPVASPCKATNLGMQGHQGLATVYAPESRPILIVFNFTWRPLSRPGRAPSPAGSVLPVTSHICPTLDFSTTCQYFTRLGTPNRGNNANGRPRIQAASKPYDDSFPNGAARDVFPGSAAASTGLTPSNGTNGLHTI